MTLTSCLIAIVISLILLTLALPRWQHFRARSQATAAVDRMVSALKTARAVAIEYAQTVSICPSADGQTCGTDWSSGQLIFRDPNNIGQPDQPEQRIRFFAKLPKDAHWQWRGFPPRQVIQFLSNGLPREQNGTFYYCPKNQHYTQSIILSKAGRIRVVRHDDYTIVSEHTKACSG